MDVQKFLKTREKLKGRANRDEEEGYLGELPAPTTELSPLPSEMLERVFKFLSLATLLKVVQVSRMK